MKKIQQKYGWIPDLPDHRDLRFSLAKSLIALPSKIDLRGNNMPAVLSQGQLGSCTANAIASAHEFAQYKSNTKEPFTPSRLFIYFNERVMEGTVHEDAGAMIRDGIKSIAQKGVCPETEWPYDIASFTKKPPVPCYKHAKEHQALKYSRLNVNLSDIKACLASGFPFVFGFAVYQSFETAEVTRTGIMPMPSKKERQLGGHAVLACGYDDSTQRVIVKNSWGVRWGDKGFFYMPYKFIINQNLCDDFWNVQIVEV